MSLFFMYTEDWGREQECESRKEKRKGYPLNIGGHADVYVDLHSFLHVQLEKRKKVETSSWVKNVRSHRYREKRELATSRLCWKQFWFLVSRKVEKMYSVWDMFVLFGEHWTQEEIKGGT